MRVFGSTSSLSRASFMMSPDVGVVIVGATASPLAEECADDNVMRWKG